ncbi:MAG: NAD-dependent epimerase/dehydratase family protein [Hyphomicrobiaceae bacterium]
MAQNVALISGATGVVGHRLAAHLAGQPDWRVIALSRRPPRVALDGVRYVAVDLTDRQSTREALAGVAGVSHLFHAARYDHATDRPEPADVNAAMLVHLLEALEAPGHALCHVHLVQGSKYYGSQLGPYRTPAREDDPRCVVSNFYYLQEDTCIARCGSAGWTWSASRPHAVCDRAPGIARSLSMVIAVYAGICRELGLPFRFPGTPENFNAVYQCTDAAHLAKAI